MAEMRLWADYRKYVSEGARRILELADLYDQAVKERDALQAELDGVRRGIVRAKRLLAADAAARAFLARMEKPRDEQ